MAVAENTRESVEEILLKEGLVSQVQVDDARKRSESTDRSVAQELVSSGVITEGMKLGILQKKLGYKLVDLSRVKASPMAADRVPRELCEKLGLIAYDMDQGKLVVAMEDPSNKKALDALHHCTELPIIAVLAKTSEINGLINQVPKKSEVQQEKGAFWKFLSIAFLPVVAIGPIFIVLSMLYFLPSIQKAYRELQYEPFELVLIFVLVWCAWAFIAYWISGLIFGTGEEEDDDI